MIHTMNTVDPDLHHILNGDKKSIILNGNRGVQKDDILVFKDQLDNKVKYYRYNVTHIHTGEGLCSSMVDVSISYIIDNG